MHNLARYIQRLGVATQVVRNDTVSVADVLAIQPQAIVLSPGPCTPCEAGVSLEIVEQLHDRVPMLGVCLGHQAIAQALGGRVVRGEAPWHGRSAEIEHEQTGLFAGIPSPLQVGRYHSLVVEPASLPAELEATAWADHGRTLMALRHINHPVVGVQFHPESILTEGGYPLLQNFLKLAQIECRQSSAELAQGEQVMSVPTWGEPDRPITF